MKIKYYCIENCGKKISYTNWLYGGKRCRSCTNKNKKSELTPNFKDGRTLKKHYCKCGKELKNYTAKRCKKCWYKFLTTLKGKKSFSWRGGISKNKKHKQTILKLWRQKNPLKVKVMNLCHRIGTQDLTINTIQQVYAKNIKKYGILTCYLCLNPIELGKDTLEHKIPLSRKGNNKKENLEVACQKCNCRKHNKTVEEFRKEEVES